MAQDFMRLENPFIKYGIQMEKIFNKCHEFRL